MVLCRIVICVGVIVDNITVTVVITAVIVIVFVIVVIDFIVVISSDCSSRILKFKYAV